MIKLAKVLSRLGFHNESAATSSLVKSASPPPLEGVVPLDKWERPDFGPEEDEEGNPIEKRFDRIKRQKRILRDRREREFLKRKMEGSPLPIEEQEEAELGEWYKAIGAIADPVILIPFDKEYLERNDEALMGFGAVFGFHPRNYKDFYEKANMLNGSNKEGEVNKLKTIFPALWADIQNILNDKKLSEDDAVFMLYNQENSPNERLQNFTKNPFFFGHDMGHNVFDSNDGDWEFKAILNGFISEMYELYMSEVDEESGEESVPASTEMEDEEEEEMTAQIGTFFPNPSGPEDSYGDVFQAAASGNLRVNIPESISLDNWYVLPPENKAKAEELKNKIIAELNSYMNSNHQYGTKGSGPLSYFAGKVILNDV